VHHKLCRVAFQKYCEAMKKLGMKLMEILAISLGLDRLHFKYLFEDGCSIMRCNYYPSCQEPSVALGTGPHCDPTTLTILHQDQVGGLDVFADQKWQTVRPRSDAFVVNIGDTFTVCRTSQNITIALHHMHDNNVIFCMLPHLYFVAVCNSDIL